MAKQEKKEKLSPRVIIKLAILIFVIAAIILVPIIYSGTTYIKAWNTNKVTPYSPTISESDNSGSTTTTETPKISGLILDDVKRIDNKDFNLFDVNFQATSYNDRESDGVQKVEFSLVIKKNDNTPKTLTNTSSTSSYLLQAGACLCANWVGLNSYTSSLSGYSDSYLTNGTSRTLSVACKTQFPAKADTWPVKVTVEAPECYLYLYFRTQENGKYVNNSYILKYTYDEFMTSTTKGGIQK